MQATITRTTATLSCRSSRITQREHVTIEDVFDAYYDCRRHKRSKRSAVEYELNYEMENYRLWQELNAMTYKPGTSTAFCVTRPKLREVFAAGFRDRVVHHLLIGRINWAVESRLSDSACACREGKGTLYAARRLRDMMNAEPVDWYVKGDIRGFFMSIRKDILLRLVCDVIRDVVNNDVDWWMWLAEVVVTHRPELDCELHGNTRLWDGLPDNKTLFKTGGVGVPIGNLTSQVFANLYLAEFDKWVISRLGSDMRYIRYADDFVMIHPDKRVLLGLVNEARDWLRCERGLALHEHKVTIQRVCRGVGFVGCLVKGGVIHPGRRLRANALGVSRRWAGKPEHSAEERVKLRNTYNSYSGLLRHLASYRLRRKMWRSLGDYRNLNNINMNKIKITRQ